MYSSYKENMGLFDIILIIVLAGSGIMYFATVSFSDDNLFIFYISTISITFLSLVFLLFGIRFLFIADDIYYGLFMLIIIWGIVFYIFFSLTLDYYKDIPYAIENNFSYVEGRIENLTTYTSSKGGTSQNFIINGVEFTTDPNLYEFKQEDEGKIFLFQYLPNSKHIINITRVYR